MVSVRNVTHGKFYIMCILPHLLKKKSHIIFEGIHKWILSALHVLIIGKLWLEIREMNLKLPIQLCDSTVGISKPTWGIRTKPPPRPGSGQTLSPRDIPVVHLWVTVMAVTLGRLKKRGNRKQKETVLVRQLHHSPSIPPHACFLLSCLPPFPHPGSGGGWHPWSGWSIQPPLLLPHPPASSLHPSKQHGALTWGFSTSAPLPLRPGSALAVGTVLWKPCTWPPPTRCQRHLLPQTWPPEMSAGAAECPLGGKVALIEEPLI